MAMYYYASKLSAAACGTRCRQGLTRRQRNRNASRNQQHRAAKKDDDEDSDDNNKDKKALSSVLYDATDDTIVISVKSSEQPEVCCESTPTLAHTALGSGGVMYGNGNIASGPLDSLIELLMPANADELDQEYVFSFLLSCRFFIRTYELLGTLLETLPEPEPVDRFVPLLAVWTKMFPYDFRDERMMNHVKHIVARCADTKLADVVSELLCALLARLTELEKHEEELKSYQSTVDNKTESITWPNASQLAQVLCRIERNLAKHVGPEEFVQCSANLLKDPNREDFTPKPVGWYGPSGGASLDTKKTCNLESYLEWSARLRMLVASEILKWSKLSTTTSQQLDCMQRHAEGCGNLWSKQTETSSSGGGSNCGDKKRKPSATTTATSSSFAVSKAKSNEWVVVPVFVDIVKLALKSREDCCVRLPNGHINMTAFDRMAAIAGAFTKHMCQVNQTLPDVGEFANLCRHMQSCKLQNESELMLASFSCEEPTIAEKELYDVA
ncbi:ras-GEF domain-containing family member 1B isoform X2 [Armigeres subalbatus]|uniref:ras-GEF domain-containing family member 1B isoform X2 n=1 Tax=Armigeres subalbatus TaxID=124917 RepID=UPI002ED2A8CC